MRKIILIVLIILFLSFLAGIFFYPYLPERMASHWNAQGQANDYVSKWWGTFLLPLITAGLLIVMIFLPKLDPLKKNVELFQKHYDYFILALVLFLTYLYALTLLWNLNLKFNFTLAIVPAFSVLFYGVGILISKAKRNYFIGIRTPWTLNNEEVWNKTHQLGGKLFKIAAIVSLLSLLIPKYAIVLVIVPILGVSLFTVFYSYWIYKQMNSKRKL